MMTLGPNWQQIEGGNRSVCTTHPIVVHWGSDGVAIEITKPHDVVFWESRNLRHALYMVEQCDGNDSNVVESLNALNHCLFYPGVGCRTSQESNPYEIYFP